MTYELEESADNKTREATKKQLVRDLAAALHINLGHHLEDKAASQDVEGVPAKADDPSIWNSATGTIEYSDSFGEGPKQSILLPQCPRGYIRIIPAGWIKQSAHCLNSLIVSFYIGLSHQLHEKLLRIWGSWVRILSGAPLLNKKYDD